MNDDRPSPDRRGGRKVTALMATLLAVALGLTIGDAARSLPHEHATGRASAIGHITGHTTAYTIGYTTGHTIGYTIGYTIGRTGQSDPATRRDARATATRMGTTADSATPAPSALAPAVNMTPYAPGVTLDSGRDEPDPFLLEVHGTYYLFTSQGDQHGNPVPVRTGRRLGAWGPVAAAMPVGPAWAVPGYTWAPDVHRFGRRWVLYFTSIVRGSSPSMQCIGAAVGRAPAGPFVPGPRPFICQVDQHGSIDPRTYVAPDGTTYMLFKSDDNAPDLATPTNIYSQPLSASGLQLLAGPTRIFGPDQRWQGNIVEAPDMVAVDGTTWLFYSGNWFNEPDYAIGFARCTGPLGPCADVTTHPLLASNFQGRGPGEESLFENGQGIFMLYTPFLYNSFGYSAPRPVLMVRLGFGPFGPYLGSPGPTVAPPLAPPVVPPVAAPSPAAAPGTSGRPTSTPRSLSAGGQPSSGVT